MPAVQFCSVWKAPVIRCIAAISILIAPAQAQEFSCKVFTSKNGLPSSYVYGAWQDSLGYMWVGTPDGLSRFDGKSFVNFGLSDGLPDTRTWGMFVDSRKRYWVATPKGTVQLLGNRFVNYPLSDSTVTRSGGAIYEKKDGRLWMLTSAGVYQLSGNTWDKIPLYPGYENHACRNIQETSDGLYINYGDLLLLQKPGNIFKIIGPLQKSGYYYNQLTTANGQMLVSTEAGLCTIHNQQLIQLPGSLGKQNGLYAYLVDSKKRTWISRASEGLWFFAPGETDHFTTIIKPSGDFLPQTITEDCNGNIWVGTGTGLVKVEPQGLEIFSTSPIIGKNKVLRTVMQPPTGPLLLNDGTLSLRSFEDGHFTGRTLQKGGGPALPNNELIIDNTAFDDQGRYWFYVRGFALVMQDKNKLYNQQAAYAPLGNEVFDVLFDQYRKKILVAINGQPYPCKYDNPGYSTLPVVNNVNVQGAITKLHQCSDGTILFTTDRGTLYSISKQNICKQQLNEFKSERRIRYMANDPSGDVWILYAGMGARCYTWQGDQLVFKEQLSKANERSNENVKCLCFDNSNRLWLCTSTDVAVFERQGDTGKQGPYKMVSFFDAQDLAADGNPDTKLVKDNQGNIWFYSPFNLVCFNPEKISYISPVPSIQVERVDLNLKKTNWQEYADSLTGVFQLPADLTLEHDNNTMGFYFKGISSSGTNGLLYSYQLQGLSNEWSAATVNDFISFVKLPPGRYSFRVRAQLPGTSWSKPASFSFEIRKAFWQTVWFLALCFLAVAGIFYSIYQVRINQLKKLLEIRREISSDLHDEIGSALTSIQILSKVSLSYLDKDVKKSDELLRKISSQSENIQQSISDIVWAIKPGNDKIETLVTRMREYLGQTAEPKNIVVEFSVKEDIFKENIGMQFRHHLFLIFKEAVNNAVKYAQATKLVVILAQENNQFMLSVNDNGLGFQPQVNPSSNGLKNMAQRAKALKGTLKIDSEEGQGTCVTFQCNITGKQNL